MKKVEFKLPSTAWGFPIASARFFTFHYSLFTKRRKLTRLWLARHVQNQSRITLMRRICSFHGFLLCCWISLRLSGAMIVTDYLLLEESCAVQAQIQSERNPISSGNVRLNEIREKIKSVASALSVNFLSACGLSRRWRSISVGYCLPDSSHYMLYKSRDFVPGYSRFARYWLPAKTGYDYLLLKSIQRRIGAKTIRSKSNTK